jgi:hypothetical protein
MRLGDNARKAALQHSWDEVADQVADLYHKLVPRGNPV